jgi:hypothetical protein
MSRKPAGLDPGDTTMNRLSIRMILFIVVLSALHISAIAPLKPLMNRPIHANYADRRSSDYTHTT